MKTLYETIFDTTVNLDDFIIGPLRDLTGTEQIKIVNRQLMIHDANWDMMSDEEFAQFFDTIKGWCSKIIISSTRNEIFPIPVNLEGFDIECKNLTVYAAWNHRVTLKNCEIKTDDLFELSRFDIIGCTIKAWEVQFRDTSLDDFTIDASTQFQAFILGFTGGANGRPLEDPRLMMNALLWKISTDGSNAIISTDPIKYFGLKKNFRKYPTYTYISFWDHRLKEKRPGCVLTNQSSIPKDLREGFWMNWELNNVKQYKIEGSVHPYKYLYTNA